MLSNLIAAFSFGILSSVGVCLASCTPILVSYLISTQKDSRKFAGGIAFFVLTRAIIFISTVAIVFIIGDLAREFIKEQVLLLRIIGGTFISAMGIIIFLNKHINLKFFRTRSKGLLFLAMLFGIKPCLPHIFMWGYCLMAAENVSQAVMIATAFSLGENITPVAIGLLGSRVLRYFRGRFYRIATRVAGAVIFILGVVFILYCNVN